MRYECPINDLTCPYCKADGECTIDGNPMDECDDYAYYNYDEEDDDSPEIVVMPLGELMNRLYGKEKN